MTTGTLKAAGESVRRRGFLTTEGQAPTFDDSLLMAQFTRLVEEVGELGRAMRHNDGATMLMELADVAIVCGAIAAHKGWNLDAAVNAKCARDEMTRGHLHDGNGEHSGGGLVSVPTYTPRSGENGHVYKDYS